MSTLYSKSSSILLYILPIFYGLCFFSGSILQLHYFVLNDADFSYFLTQPWGIWNYGDWTVPFAYAFEGSPYYAIHCTPVSALLAPVIGLLPSEYTLSVLHAASAAWLAFLIPRIALAIYGKDDSRWMWTSTAILLIFFFYRPYIAAWSRQTHYTTLVTPFLAQACLCLHKKHFMGAILCAIIVCLGQERAAVAIFGLGMYAFLLLDQRKIGIFFCTLSFFWFFGVVEFWLPWMRTLAELDDTNYVMLDRLGFFANWPMKLHFILLLSAFSCFLPFCGKQALFCASCALPNLLMAIISQRMGMYDMRGQYEDLPSVFLLISMIYGLKWIQNKISVKHWKKTFACIIGVYYLFVIPSVSSWYNPLVTSIRLLNLPQKTRLDELNKDIRYLDNIPEDTMFFVQSGLGPRAAFHKNKYMLTRNILQDPLINSVVALSPLCGNFMLGCEYEEAVGLADNNPSLKLVKDTGRLKVYATHELADRKIF